MTTNVGVVDPAVRDRVMRQIGDFKQALEDAQQGSLATARDTLSKATDKLMRAVAAVILEVGKQSRL
jgi:hypothetical protein